VVLGLAVAVAAGCASETKTRKAGSGDIVADRQRVMKLNGAAWGELQAKAKAGNLEGVAVSAETLALNSQQIPSLFPAGSLTDKSKAKPEVWQKWPEFEAAAKKMETESEKLRDAARAKNEQLVQDIVKDYGRNACGACHTPFRVPPPRTS
jgi:cytochrome c556